MTLHLENANLSAECSDVTLTDEFRISGSPACLISKNDKSDPPCSGSFYVPYNPKGYHLCLSGETARSLPLYSASWIVTTSVSMQSMSKKIIEGRICPPDMYCASQSGSAPGCTECLLTGSTGKYPCQRLYASLGFTDFYTYWFRVQPQGGTE